MNDETPKSQPSGIRFFLLKMIVTWFGSGLLPKAPGTWGSLAAVPFAWVLIPYLIVISVFLLPFSLIFMPMLIVLLFTLSTVAVSRYMKHTQTGDPKEVVIDEVWGVFVTLFIFSLVSPRISWFDLTLAFILFRLFDIFKPWPASWFDKRHDSAFCVMMDDVVAGIYAAICVILFIKFAYPM